jgi:hypothetical protein
MPISKPPLRFSGLDWDSQVEVCVRHRASRNSDFSIKWQKHLAEAQIGIITSVVREICLREKYPDEFNREQLKVRLKSWHSRRATIGFNQTFSATKEQRPVCSFRSPSRFSARKIQFLVIAG